MKIRQKDAWNPLLGYLLREILKRNWACSVLTLATLCPSGLASYALAGNGPPALSHGDSLAQSSGKVSTQLPKFPMANHYHASSMLQNPHDLYGAHLANPCNKKLVQKQRKLNCWVQQLKS